MTKNTKILVEKSKSSSQSSKLDFEGTLLAVNFECLMIQAISTEVKVNLAVSVILQKYSNFIGSATDDFDSEETSIMLIGANKPLVIHVIYVHAAAFSCDVLQKFIVS